MEHKFWGSKQADVQAITGEYKGIHTPADLYDALPKSGAPIPVRQE